VERVSGTHRVESYMVPRAGLDAWRREKNTSCPGRDSNQDPSDVQSLCHSTDCAYPYLVSRQCYRYGQLQMKHNYFMCGHKSDKVAINLLGNTDVAMRCVTTLHRTTVVIKRCAASTERLRTTAVQNDSFFRHTIRLVTDHHYFSCTKSRNVML
jgi:hypothetical protein